MDATFTIFMGTLEIMCTIIYVSHKKFKIVIYVSYVLQNVLDIGVLIGIYIFSEDFCETRREFCSHRRPGRLIIKLLFEPEVVSG